MRLSKLCAINTISICSFDRKSRISQNFNYFNRFDLRKCMGLTIDLTGQCPWIFQRSFDCVNHGLLITKLSAYGLKVDALQLVRSYLINRMQRVKINSSYSNWGKKIEKLERRKGRSQGLYYLIYL